MKYQNYKFRVKGRTIDGTYLSFTSYFAIREKLFSQDMELIIDRLVDYYELGFYSLTFEKSGF